MCPLMENDYQRWSALSGYHGAYDLVVSEEYKDVIGILKPRDALTPFLISNVTS